jgi:hypothetical protein
MKKRRIPARPGAAAVFLLGLLLLLPAKARGAEEDCFPAGGWGCPSLVDALKSLGAESDFDYRAKIAQANGYRDYRGEACQNEALLWLLRNGALRRPEAAEVPLRTNQGRVRFISQGRKTCKATAAAMALNLVTGSDRFATADLGGACCRGLDGETYTGSDGLTYRAVYKTDGYEGSLRELTKAIDDALDAGLPVVAAVHSTKGGTRHHWVLILGRSGDDWLIADPARAGSGSIADNAVTLSSRGYALGLADYEALHYGYVTFLPA